MANRSSATSGNWRADNADTWGLGIGNYPAAGDLVTILNGHDVTLVEDNVAGAVVTVEELSLEEVINSHLMTMLVLHIYFQVLEVELVVNLL